MKVNKSSKECADYNAAHKLEIDHGVTMPWEPADETLQREARAASEAGKRIAELNRIKLLILNALNKSNYAHARLNVEKVINENLIEKDYGSTTFHIEKIPVRIERFSSYDPGMFGRCRDVYYRLEIHGENIPPSRFQRYSRTTRSSFAKLKENMSSDKLATWFNEKVGAKIATLTQQRAIAEANQSAEQRKEEAFKQNEAAFKALGIDSSSMLALGHGDEDGKIGVSVRLMLTPAQWMKLAEFKTQTLPSV